MFNCLVTILIVCTKFRYLVYGTLITFHYFSFHLISKAEIDVLLKVTSMATNKIASFRLPRKIFLKRRLTIVIRKWNFLIRIFLCRSKISRGFLFVRIRTESFCSRDVMTVNNFTLSFMKIAFSWTNFLRRSKVNQFLSF